MEKAILVLIMLMAGCATRARVDTTITPQGDMPERFRVRSMFSDPSDDLLNNYNSFAEKMNLWIWDYSRGKNDLKAAAAAEKAFDRLTSTPGWAVKKLEVSQ